MLHLSCKQGGKRIEIVGDNSWTLRKLLTKLPIPVEKRLDYGE
jgi:hypothetical protein